MPEASVRRRAQALSGFTGRKGYHRRFGKYMVKAPGSTGEKLCILLNLRSFGDAGIPGVVVKCVDIRRNTEGEGRHLGRF